MSNGIDVTVVAATKRGVRLALRVPDGVTVLRGEVYDAIAAANSAGAQSLVDVATAPGLELHGS